MTSLHKFKLLATQCSISDTPTHSPTTSPVFHLRRRRRRHRKTLRMFLSRSTDHPLPSPPPPEKRVRRKLKDLFVSSSPPIDHDNIKSGGDRIDNRSSGNNSEIEFLPDNGSIGDGLPARRRVVTSSSGSFRYRFMLRRAWRPVLISIPESD